MLAAMGIEPVLHNGSLDFAAAGSIKQSAAGLSADLGLSQFSLTDGDAKWLSLDALRIRQATFDGHVAAVSAVEIDKPTARVTRDAGGLITAAGMKFLPTIQPVAPPPVLASGEATLPATQPAIAAPPAIVARLQSFKLNETRLQWVDGEVTPAAELSLTLSATASNLVTGEDAPPSTFKITLASPGVVDSLLIAGQLHLTPAVSQVDLQITAAGVYGQSLEPYLPANAKVDFNNGQFTAKLSATTGPNPDGGIIVPRPKGYVKVSLSGLEMSAIRGLASQQGIKIDRGTFDLRTDVRMDGGDSFVARVYPTFNDLRISESPNGFLQRLLKLPAPLNVVTSTLEQSDGSISVPITVPFQAGKLDTGAVVESAIGSIGRAVGSAMLAAPMKAASGLISIVGIDTGGGRTAPIPPIVIDFAPGESQLSPVQRKIIDSALKQMRDDDSLEATIQHSLGAADVTLAEQRSNPAKSDTTALAARLRQRKSDLTQDQADRETRLRVALASQNSNAADAALAALRATSIDLKGVDDSLEQVLTLLQPGADRQTERRTRSAAIFLGDLRLRSVQQSMLQSDVANIAEHVRKANATFNPADGDSPGRVTITLVRRAKQ